jgi:spiro-SPASM protein
VAVLKTCALLHIDDNISEESLTIAGRYLPDYLGSKLRGIAGVSDVMISVPSSFAGKKSDGMKPRAGHDDITAWREAFSTMEADNIVRIYCDSPFMDADVIAGMIDVHHKYLPEFTYSENLPQGFSCEIASRALIDSIPESPNKMLPLGDIVRKNIHQFDIEIFYKDPDLRGRRLSFRSGDPREKRVMEDIIGAAGGFPRHADIEKIFRDHPEVLYSAPSYLEIELTGMCDLDCVFCFRKCLKSPHGDMDPSLFKKILGGMREFSLPYSICLGGSGEPLMHPGFYEAAESALAETLLKNLVIETNGIYAGDNFKSFAGSSGQGKIKVICNINGLDAETYKKIHGADYFDTVSRNVISLKEKMGDKSLYVQIMKINETEPFLDRFYDFWEKTGIPIILQKQNTYLGRLQDRRYSDLSPIERTSCWHLQRDMYILHDGRAGFCKQDFEGSIAKGDLKTETLLEVWNKSKGFFIRDFGGELLTSPDCRSCDEWYTFNL